MKVAIALAAAIGTGAGMAWILLALEELARHITHLTLPRHRKVLEKLLGGRARQEEKFDPYGVAGVNWEMWRIAGAAVGYALAYAAVGNPVVATFGLAGAFVPRLVEGFVVRRRRMEIAQQVREFIFLLRAALTMHGGLRPALEETAASLEGGIVKERLAYHLERARLAEEVMARMASDLRSKELKALVERVKAARQGGLGLEEAISMVAEELCREMVQEAEFAIREAPIRLLIPMLFLLLPPIFILALYPIVARLLALIGGVEAPQW